MPRKEVGEKCRKDLFKKKNRSFVFLFAIGYKRLPYTVLPRRGGRGCLAVPAAPAAGRGRFHRSGPGGGHTAHRGGHSGTPGGGPGGAAGVTVGVDLSVKGLLFLDNILTDSDKFTPLPAPPPQRVSFFERNTKSIN
jgi:hypothetical protein